MISVARSYSWANPETLNNMYVDSEDVFGLMLWYNDVQEQNKEIENKTKKP